MATITDKRSPPQNAERNGALNGADLEFGADQHVTTQGWGNAGPLSLLAFAVVTLMLSLINVKAISAEVTPVVASVGLIFGGTTQLIGGLIQMRTGNTFQGALFTSFGAFWIALAAILQWYVKEVPAAQVGHALGLLLYGFTPLVLVLWLASFRTSRVVVVALGTVLVTFVLLAIGNYGAHTALIHVGGVTGIIAAVLAFYLALAELCEFSYGRVVLPVWPLAKD
ncbi:MAG: acetate uptake transporter [Solirubrobacteraceae bacterium]